MNTTLVLSLALAAAPGPEPSHTVPFELLRSGHMAVQVTINGKGPYRLIFDTGAPVTLISTRAARAADLIKQQPQKRPVLPIFGGGEVVVKKLEVGNVPVADSPAVVMDHPTVEAMGRVLGPIDGIVGFPFFARFRTSIDYQAKSLTLTPNGFKPPDVMRSVLTALMASDADAVKVLAPAGLWGMSTAKDDDDVDEGITITTVFAGGPAAKAGLKANDRLLTIAGRWTDSLDDLHAAAERCPPGKAVSVRVRRGGKVLTLSVSPAPGL